MCRSCASRGTKLLNPQCWKVLTFQQLRFHVNDRGTLTKVIRFYVDHSRGCATTVVLPSNCTSKGLKYVAKGCPGLEYLCLLVDIRNKIKFNLAELVPSWQHLECLALQHTPLYLGEILTQISLRCKDFSSLMLRGCIDDEEVLAIAIITPKIKVLNIKGSTLLGKNFKLILQSCKELEYLDATKCIGFDEDDEEILKLASHIKTSKFKGSMLYHCDNEWIGINDMDCPSDFGSD
ncbi:hypothetical protein GIB67_007004 [Kingdonia uniflora]|uniref:Uncharacterized protein n=1 Tax=Kingdonia uniflora TaxID=39325 RepID=A0A7J7NZ74_9MAGN|nr:hypothetical protein GIB67_007004 [Kingdonia uniflora]